MADKKELKQMFSDGKKPSGDDFSQLIEGVEGPKGEPGKDGEDGAKGDPGKDGDDGKDAENQFTEEQVKSLLDLIEE